MQNFNSDWKFTLETENNYQPIVIPHDWLITDTKNLYKNSVGLYKKLYTIPNTPTPNEKYFLCFDGIYQDSTLLVNGQTVGNWKNGYTPFHHDITNFLRQGENEFLVRVNYQSPNTRWYSGAGIYRDCFLIKKNATHFKLDGIYIHTRKINNDEWEIEVEAEVIGDEYEIRHSFCGGFTPTPPPAFEKAGQNFNVKPCECTVSDKSFEGVRGNFSKSFPEKELSLWSVDNPNCYVLTSELIVDGVVVDTVHTRFGFREIKFTRDGFFLNGERVEFKGVCQHHDLGAIGSAFHRDAARRQLEILRGMGVNAIRMAHNPPAAGLMELCDEMGFLVMNEFSDVWKRGKTKYDYARFFEDWAERDVAAWVRRDRNCPSNVMWSVGNEIYDTHADAEDGAKTLRFLMGEVEKHDPKGNGAITLCSNYMPWENTQKCADIVKLMGYNYAEYLYEKHKKEHEDWLIYGSETAAIVASRGVYHFPLAKALLADDDFQCSALGNSATSWGAKSTEILLENHRGEMGQFIWTGFDYIGEPTPYHTKNSYFGQIDTAGFPKDGYYIFASEWKKETVLHLYPYWDWSPGQPVDVRIASNAPKTELFLNDKSLGFGRDFIVPYETGCLRAVAYDENLVVIDESCQHSYSCAVAPVLTSERIGELTFITITAVDANGREVKNANNRVNITVENGELLGLDNGDSTDYDQYQGTNSRRLFSGKLLAIVKGDSPKVTAEFDEKDIPIRKIELVRDFDDLGESGTVTAKIYPENATYRDLHWRLADAAGIDSHLARLEVAGNTATIFPKGDGEVFVRCATTNGGEEISLISMLPITISGYGTPFLDPYSFISAGLYSNGNDTVTNGNERGVATARDTESIFGFDDLDFGSYGADEIKLWLFPLSGEPFNFEIWDGENLLLVAPYDKGSKWNTYFEVSYKLPEKLRGVQKLQFVFRQKVHVKGFQFKCKTFDEIPFAACDEIYGDSFTKTDRSVEKIGNNVTISFAAMNFDTPATQLELKWRSRLESNTIKMLFEGEEGEISNMLSLPASSGYSTRVLALENPIIGKGTVRFIFLPGSEIDLEHLKFLPADLPSPDSLR